MKILIIGPHPPHILGGIAIHVQRLAQHLLRAGNDVTVLDYMLTQNELVSPGFLMGLPRGRIPQLLTLIKIAQNTSHNTIVHIHTAGLRRFKWVAPLFLTLFSKQPKILTIHAGEFSHEMHDPISRLYLRWMMRQFRHIVSVNREIADRLRGDGISIARVSVVPAFIPAEPDPRLAPQVIAEHNNKITILTSGNLRRQYNHDILIDCIACLDPDKYQFVFVFYLGADSVYEQRIMDRLSVFHNVIVFRDLPPEEYMAVVYYASIYVRTCITDGDSIAVREALYLGKTVFAADVVVRPAGCHLFSLDDSETLRTLFKEFDEGRISALDVPRQSYAEDIVSIYRKVLATSLHEYDSDVNVSPQRR